MVGLNVEMARELLWRGFPTDQRGTYFDQFWDVRAAPAARRDIDAAALWRTRALGDAPTAPAREQFVMLMRSALLRRYPNAIIYATPARVTNGVRAPSADRPTKCIRRSAARCSPTSPSSASTSTHRRGDRRRRAAGYFIVIQEQPTEPRFGFDVGTAGCGGASHLALGTRPAGRAARVAGAASGAATRRTWPASRGSCRCASRSTHRNSSRRHHDARLSIARSRRHCSRAA